ncbi:MAG: ketopantoate reductase family protein [Anaerolineaceae bacterium]|nr:ketopantoate reductase family protein [Anaerolineaceae bacterium]
MKVLIFGAGIIGSVLAADLMAGGTDVTILARGQHLHDLREYGIVLKPIQGDAYQTIHPKIVETLTPEDDYDLVIIPVRRSQHASILPVLAVNRKIPAFLFIGNNLGGGKDAIDALGAERVLFGFYGSAGQRRGDIIYYTSGATDGHRNYLYLGQPADGNHSPFNTVAAFFESMNIFVDRVPNFDAWLKCHAALVLPLAFGIYTCGGSNYRLAETRDSLLMIIRGMKEGFRALRKLKYPILPRKFSLMRLLPEPILLPILQKLLKSEFAEIGLAAHANAARDEMSFLAREFRSLIEKSGTRTPNLDMLFRYADPEEPQLPQGSSRVKVNWKPVWIGASILASLLGLLGFLFLGKRRKGRD